MKSAHRVEQIRAAEAAALAGLPPGALMGRAAFGLASAVAEFLGGVYGKRVLLLVGSGDNGGDTVWAGRLLARRGAVVRAVMIPAETMQMHRFGPDSGDFRFTTVHEEGSWPDVNWPDVVLDGIVGIGARPGLRAGAAKLAATYAHVPTIAVDLPSGVGVDTAEINGSHVRAQLTVTFGTYKVAHLVDPAAQACGEVRLVDLDLALPEPELTAWGVAEVVACLPRPDLDAHKYRRGVIGLRTGSAEFPGAAVLSVGGALTGFAGMARYDGLAAAEVIAAYPEVVPGSGQVQAWVTGCGGGEGAAAALQECLADQVPVVIDAQAIQHLVDPLDVPAIVTPHAGELAALLGIARAEIEARQLLFARGAAAELNAVVVLKGRRTLIAEPTGQVRVNESGTPWLATAGAGDVLAGLIGALVAAGLTPFDAATAGVWLHGSAAESLAAGGPLRSAHLAAEITSQVAELSGRTPGAG